MEWITIKEASKVTGKSASTLKRVAAQGKIKAEKDQIGVWKINKSSLLAFYKVKVSAHERTGKQGERQVDDYERLESESKESERAGDQKNERVEFAETNGNIKDERSGNDYEQETSARKRPYEQDSGHSEHSDTKDNTGNKRPSSAKERQYELYNRSDERSVVATLQDVINTLQNQLEAKDDQIQAGQVLQAQAHERIKELESRIKELEGGKGRGLLGRIMKMLPV